MFNSPNLHAKNLVPSISHLSLSLSSSVTSLSYGDSYLRDSVIGLTLEIIVPSSSSNFVIYNFLIPFYQPESNTTASFSMRFFFYQHQPGLVWRRVYFLPVAGSSYGYLSLVNLTRLTKNKFLHLTMYQFY